jgi:hypothetical protein
MQNYVKKMLDYNERSTEQVREFHRVHPFIKWSSRITLLVIFVVTAYFLRKDHVTNFQ